MSEQTTVSGSVDIDMLLKFKTANDVDNSAFRNLRELAINCGNEVTFLEKCSDIEDNFMERFYNNDENAKKKNGSWKKASYLPSRYLSSKSVLKQALQYGVDIEEKAKTTIEKHLKKSKAALTPTSPLERATTWVEKTRRSYDSLDDDVKEFITLNINTSP